MRQVAVLLIGCVALAAVAADRQVTTQEARTWVSGIRAAEQRGDAKTVMGMTREETVFYVGLSAYAGEGFTLKGANLKEWIERNVARNKGKVKGGVRCGYEPVPEDGTVIERCVGPAAELVAGAGAGAGGPEFIYTVNVIAKDGRGLFSKTTWVSDKKLF